MDGVESLTILKYKLFHEYKFKVLDKFDEADEPARLDLMIEISANMAQSYGESYEELWIKTCPIFPTK